MDVHIVVIVIAVAVLYCLIAHYVIASPLITVNRNPVQSCSWSFTFNGSGFFQWR
jgi:hypothetical protein